MKFTNFLNIVLNNTSRLTKIEGEKLYKEDVIYDVVGKKIDDYYNIYSRAKSENKEICCPYIKIDLKSLKLIKTDCSCVNYRENSKLKKNYVCKHIFASILKFSDLMHKKMGAECRSKFVKREKIKLDLKISDVTKKELLKNNTWYELEMRIGVNGTYIIENINEFLNAYKNNFKYTLNNKLTFDKSRYYFNECDEYLIMNLLKNEQKFVRLKDTKSLYINEKQLSNLLTLINLKTICFNFKKVEYKVKVRKEKMPITYTVNQNLNEYELKMTKKRPISLSNDGRVYFYNNSLYVFSKENCKFQKMILDKFSNKDKIIFKKDIKNLLILIQNLNKISDQIFICDSIKEFLSMELKDTYRLIKENEKIILRKAQNAVLDDFKEFKNKNLKFEMELNKHGFIKKEEDFLFIGDDEALYEFIKNKEKILAKLVNMNVEILNNTFNILDSSCINTSILKDEMNYKLKVEFLGAGSQEFNNAFREYKLGSKFYKTKGHDFLSFEDNDTLKLLNLIGALNSKDEIKDDCIEFYEDKLLYMQTIAKKERLDFIKGLEDIYVNTSYSLPKGLKANLREYQKSGYIWFRKLKSLHLGGILADEMGLGKTLQTITFLLSQKKTLNLIVVPTALIYNWQNEFLKFSKNLKIALLHGNKDKRDKILKDVSKYDVLITSYNTLKNDIDKYDEIIFNNIIIDEAQNIKNPKSQNAIALKSLKAENRFALTGTPIENNLIELWSIFDFLMPGYLKSKEEFKSNFILNNNDGFKELNNLIAPFILRRTKKEVLEELPDKIEIIKKISLTKKQSEFYKNYLNNIKKNLESSSLDKISIFSYITRLRQICQDPYLVDPEYTGDSAKINESLKIIKDGIKKGKKIILFSQFTSLLKKLKECLNDENIETLYLDGGTPSKERVNYADEFNLKDHKNVFLISLKAGGVGLNLQKANLVIHFDPWWNPSTEDQATDRAHRIGQENIVEVVKLIARGTIEEKIIAIKEEKKELINAALYSSSELNGEVLKGLSYSELINLLN